MSDKFTAETCCPDWDSLVDAAECKDCPQRQHYLHSKTPAKVTATTLPDEPERYMWTATGLSPSESRFGPMRYVRETDYDALLQSFNAERLRAEKLADQNASWKLLVEQNQQIATDAMARAEVAEAEVARWKAWAAYAQKRYHEETGKDLQAEGV